MSTKQEKNKDDSKPTDIKNSLIKVTINGPYIVSHNVPLSKMIIDADDECYPYQWLEVLKYPQREIYTLCRCGKSNNKPYCDNNHKEHKFDGTETAGYANYLENVKNYNGPELTLTDNKELCVGSGFCTRAGNIWNLTVHSDTPQYKETAIQEAADCPSGRLVLWDKQDKPLEPDFKPSIVITEDEDGVPGPIWVRGEIPIQSTQNKNYEIRNRVTLCRCGRSKNKPICDGSHLDP